jgi:hypothetical protein
MLLDRFPKWQCIPRRELGAVVRAGEAFDHLDQIRVLCCVGDRTRLCRRPETLIEQTENVKTLLLEDRVHDAASMRIRAATESHGAINSKLR